MTAAGNPPITMAPISNSTKAMQQNRPRPTVPRKVVPAIPLPYVQKRQQQQESARAKAVFSDAAKTPVVEPVSSQTQTVAEVSPSTTNGSLDSTPQYLPEDEKPKDEQTSGPTSTVTPAEQATEVEAKEPVAEVQEAAAQEKQTEKLQDTPTSAPSEVQSAESRPNHQMPPPFIPASHSEQNHTNPDSLKFPPQTAFSGHQPMHHTHPSAGSLMFGAYPESNTSSPAPPPSAGNAPPYPYNHHQHGGGRHFAHQSNGGHSQHMSNGYSPMGPPPGYYPRHDGFTNQGSGPDFRRPMMSFGPLDGYSPSGTPMVGTENSRPSAYDPPTPHSFHGSQSSAPNEQEAGPAFYSQYPTAVISNGSNGNIDEVRLYQQPRPKPRTNSQALATPNAFPVHPAHQPPMPMDHFDGLVNYLQSQFADASLADYTLELRYTDDRAPPVRIPGHNLMFARSPTLKQLMTNQAHDGMNVRTLLIQSEDRFLRSDGFWMAVQRLYGGPLLDLGVLAAMNAMPTNSASPMPGTPADRFHLALGYAAAGHLLAIPPVIGRGIEIASHFVNWNTVEKALDFAMDGGLDSQWTLPGGQVQEQIHSTYGPAVNMLIHSTLNFIITSFPAGFKLDPTVEESVRNRRLPVIQEDHQVTPNPRLSFIKFGDHPSEESTRSSSLNTSITITLSKILLNIPFPLLKYVLESSRLGNVQGWATTVLRQEVMHAVIEEREKRRIKVRNSCVITAEDRDRYAKDWDVVGWQESVQTLVVPEAMPTLTKTWVDFVVSDS